MAKSHRGEVTLEGDGETYVLKFGTNAICKIQDALNQPLGVILESLKDEKQLDMKTIRTMVQMALIQPANATPEAAGDLIDDVGLEKITAAFGAVFGEKAGTGNPGDPIGAVSA